MAGFIMLDRDLQNSYVFRNDRNWWMWCKLKYLENFEDGEVRLGKSRNKIFYKKGQIAILLKDLCRELRITHKPLREYLETLEDEGLITVDIQPKYTIITFVYGNENSNQKTTKSKRINETKKSNIQPTPIIEEVEEKKQSERINNKSPIFSREKEIDFFDELSKCLIFFDEMAQHLNTDVATLKEYLEQFKGHNLIIEKSHRDISDYKSHFLYWVKLELEKGARTKINDNNGTKQKECTNKYEMRRGAGVTNLSANGIKQTFSRRNAGGVSLQSSDELISD